MDANATSKPGINIKTKTGAKRKTSSPTAIVSNSRDRPYIRTAAVLLPSNQKNSNSGSDGDVLSDRKVEIASEGLNSYYSACFYKIPLKENALTLANYIISLKSEINPSTTYRREIIDKLSRFSVYCDKTLFKDITREQLLYFLANLRRPDTSDPLHKWIGTYNLYRTHLIRFFKWLYHPDIEQHKRPKPSVIEARSAY